jgi:hypothetical protein
MNDEYLMTNKRRIWNDDKGRMIGDSLHRYIVTSDLRFNDLTPHSHSSFAWHAVAWAEAAASSLPQQPNAPKKSISPS